MVPPTRQQVKAETVLGKEAGVGLVPDHEIGDAKVGQGLPGLDEAQLGF